MLSAFVKTRVFSRSLTSTSIRRNVNASAAEAADGAVKAKLLQLGTQPVYALTPPVPSLQDVAQHLPTPATSFQYAANAESTVRQLMDAGVHYGHTTQIWHRQMLPFIYGRRGGIHIINLEHTLVYLRRAMNVTREIALRGGTILFVGNRPFLSDILTQAARLCNQFYVNRPWLEGCLSNHQQTLRSASADGTLIQPDLIVVLDMLSSDACLKEANSLSVPTIGLVDTDCNPDLVTYPIPGNDDSTASVQLIAAMLANAAREGTLQRLKMLQMKQPSSQFQSSDRSRRRF
jgi:small subunit ribosomal protein S2